MSGSPAEPANWAEAARGFGSAVERYHEARGHDVTSPQVQSTLRTNTELVPRRAEMLLELLRTLSGVESVDGMRVIEAGSGFGALAGYLAWSHPEAEVLGIDIREDFVESARESAVTLGCGSRLRFEHGDMREFAGVDDGWADLVVLNNAFIYLPTKQDESAGLDALSRVTAAGGHVLFYHANRWAWRDPFSKDPIVHLLPPRLAGGVSRVTGWKHNHGRVRLLSPPAMRRRLKRAGFEDVATGGHVANQLVTGGQARFSKFYATAARRR